MIFKSFGFIYVACSYFMNVCVSQDVLEEPIPSLCSKRTMHVKSPANVNYFFSWRSNESFRLPWWEARNFCRRRCMETVSIETDAENQFLKYFIRADKVKSVWTSGHLCNFEGCDEREDLQPVHINGWFWTGSNLILGPTSERQYNDWADNSLFGVRQPDNQFNIFSAISEDCIAILSRDGIGWHDSNCYETMDFICEDNPELLKQAKKLRPKLKFEI